jgi:hypothetical protein
MAADAAHSLATIGHAADRVLFLGGLFEFYHHFQTEQQYEKQ